MQFYMRPSDVYELIPSGHFDLSPLTFAVERCNLWQRKTFMFPADSVYSAFFNYCE